MFYAHRAPDRPPHDLVEHLRRTALLARTFGNAFEAGDLAYLAGLWHDLGKFTGAFQDYLREADRRQGPEHSHAGALLATKVLKDPLAAILVAWTVAGHHTGLPAQSHLQNRLDQATDPGSQSGRLAREALERVQRSVPDLRPAQDPSLPSWLRSLTGDAGKRSQEFLTRMLFSALVDADSLDTEEYLHPEHRGVRESAPSLEAVAGHFFTDQEARFHGVPDTPVNRMRREVYRACLERAEGPQGVYRLTVPTGGGKTRSAMAFALRHAQKHGLRRVVVAIPYTSIIEQTAQVYREAFGHPHAVLEHHSAVAYSPENEAQDPQSLWARLAEENWDAPVIVTTFVRLFESLFSHRRSDCRRLHNLARSVIILDEVQTLPVGLLEPALDALRELVEHYGVTVVLCSATLPAFQEVQVPLPTPYEIVEDPERYFRDPALRRVRYEVALEPRWTWERVAEEALRHRQCMVVVNTLRDSLDLWEALGAPKDAFYLSTFLCPAHRRQVLGEVRRRLKADEPCYLICTPVVEAGVDIDFPTVLRALGPLDRIVQAGGRCNREGRLGPEGGRVLVFEPAEPRFPDGPYHTGAQLARQVLTTSSPEALYSPETYRAYFRDLFRHTSLDAKHIQRLRAQLDFPKVACKFRLIEDDTAPVVVHYPPERERVASLVQELVQGPRPPRQVLRELQPYMAEVRLSRLPGLEQAGLVRQVRPGLWEWLGTYDDRLGIGGRRAGMDPQHLVWG